MIERWNPSTAVIGTFIDASSVTPPPITLKISRWNCGKTASTSGRELGVSCWNFATRCSISSFVTILDAMLVFLPGAKQNTTGVAP